MSVASPWGPVRVTTVAMAVLVFAIVAARTRRPGLAAITVIACMWAYEVVWNATDIAVHHWGWAPMPYWVMLAAGWTGWMLSRGWTPSLRLLAVDVDGRGVERGHEDHLAAGLGSGQPAPGLRVEQDRQRRQRRHPARWD